MLFVRTLHDTYSRRSHLDSDRIYRAVQYGEDYVVLFGTPNEMPHNTRIHAGEDGHRVRAAVEAVATGNYKFYMHMASGTLPSTEAEYLAQPHLTTDDLDLTGHTTPRGLIA